MRTIFSAAMAACATVCAANAVTLMATSQNPELGDFSIEFTDANNDGFLEYNEIDSFSGFFSLSTSNDIVNTVPNIPGVSLFSFPADFGQLAENWRFLNTNPGITTASRDTWTYDLELDGVPEVVPVPAALSLLLGGLGLLALKRRRTA